MFDIDRYLDDMKLVEFEISEDALTLTKKRCEEEQKKQLRQQEKVKKVKKGTLIAVPAAAVLLAGVFLGALLFSKTVTAPQAVAYYTVDVNPSLCVEVDEQSLVTGVKGQNSDADDIVASLDCKGKHVADAIGEIITAVRDAGYIDENQKYVLIGCFAKDGTKLENTLTDLQSKLESDFGDMIDLLIVSGSIEDLQAANDLKVSPGLLKLAQLADGVNVTGGAKVGEVMDDVIKASGDGYFAPELSASVKGDSVELSWDSIDFTAMGYAGKVRYKIAAGDTEAEVKAFTAPVIKKVDFYTYEQKTPRVIIKLKPGVTKYIAIYAQYGDIIKCGNVLKCTMPGAEPTPSPTQTQTPEPTKTDEPEPTQTPMPPYTVSGRVSGEKVILTWSREAAENFNGYKVVASRTNENPKYPEDGYIKYFTDRDKTSVSLYEGTGGLKGDTYYYFSITYLFSDGSTVAGNAVRLKVPPKSADPTPKPSGDYADSTISGGLSGNKFTFSWTKVSDERFQHYKLVASYTNQNPKYNRDRYVYYTDDPEVLSKSFSLSTLIGKLGSYEAGARCYFSITVVYKDGTKIAGNSIGIDLPAPPPEEPYLETSVNASLDGTAVRLTWNPVAVGDERFVYYKVVKSFTNPHPTYPDDGYIKYFTDPARSSCSIQLSDLGGNPGDTCYFSITAVYESDVRKTGGSASIVIPAPAPEP